jgi:hypothetical protein
MENQNNISKISLIISKEKINISDLRERLSKGFQRNEGASNLV